MMNVSTTLKPVLNTINRFSGWVLLLAVAWLCWTAARLLWLLLAAPLAPMLPPAALQNTSASGKDYSGLFAIFADPDPIAAAVQPPPNVNLKGVLLAMPESMSSALLDVNGEVKNYRIGDALKDSGYTLVAVDWNSVVIADASDKQTVISMPAAMPLDQSDMIAGAVSNQRLPENSMLVFTLEDGGTSHSQLSFIDIQEHLPHKHPEPSHTTTIVQQSHHNEHTVWTVACILAILVLIIQMFYYFLLLTP